MSENVLFLAHVDDDGTLPKLAWDALHAGTEIATALQANLTIGLIGENIQAAADSVFIAATHILAVSGPEFAHPRYATDAVAIEAICRRVQPSIVIAPATSRFSRAIPGAACRLQGKADTHIASLNLKDGLLNAKRWFYRQRLEASIQRAHRPWFLLMDAGCSEGWKKSAANSEKPAAVEHIHIDAATLVTRTSFSGLRVPASDAQTIRPDAKLLFVAGAGWTKKQSDGKIHAAEAETRILEFLRNTGASLGGSKSLVDQSADKQAVLGCMTHLNQVGQTGSTPRHPKGLSTCCHGEEPHVVGWRFIRERRAVNLDPNCGWARGKADVVYVADAFQVTEKLNAMFHAAAVHDEQNAEVAAPGK